MSAAALLRARETALRASLELLACDGRALRPEEHSQALVDLWHIDHEPALDLDDYPNIADAIVEALATDHREGATVNSYTNVGRVVMNIVRGQLVDRLDAEIKAAQDRLDEERGEDGDDDYVAEHAATNRQMDAERAAAMNAEIGV